MAISIHVCKGKSCGPKGGCMLLRDIEELCEGRAEVSSSDCLGLCGMGPNVKICKHGQEHTYSGNLSYATVEGLIAAQVGPVSGVRSKLGELKFAIRREHRSKVRERLVAQCFAAVEGKPAVRWLASGGLGDTPHPILLAELLALRSQEYRRAVGGDASAAARAVEDATRAVELAPEWPQAHRVLADALDVSGRLTEAADRLKIAMSMGGGLDPDSTAAQLRRLEKGISKQHASATEIHLDEAPLHFQCRGNHEYRVEEVPTSPLLAIVSKFAGACSAPSASADASDDEDQFGNLNFFFAERNKIACKLVDSRA